MKKWLLLLSACLIILLLILYFLIPTQIQINRSVGVKANSSAAYRNLLADQTWKTWWPAKSEANDIKSLVYEDAVYKLDQKLFNAFAITIDKEKTTINTELNLIPDGQDSLNLVWSAKLPTASGPFDKISKYFQSRTIGEQMEELLSALKKYLGDEQNLYGSIIRQTKVKDSVLVATRLTLDHYPTTDEIYGMVDKLKAYIQEKGAKETDFPMLHVDSARGSYTTMVGIPTDTLVNGNNVDIDLKRLVLGNILVTEVRGGTFTTRRALQQLEHYVYDYKRTSPAIPYESLVTDRRKERDTTKWITKIYYPVF